jgi:hypothetical protein
MGLFRLTAAKFKCMCPSRTRWISLCQVFLIAVVLFIWITAHRIRPAFSEPTCNRIRIGMTKQELVSILCVPPGDYSTEQDSYPGGGSTGIKPGLWLVWCDDEGRISARIDEFDKVADVDFTPVLERSIVSRILSWLKNTRLANSVFIPSAIRRRGNQFGISYGVAT